MFYLGDKVLDDSFFKNFMRSFEPVFTSELAPMTQQIIEAIKKSQSQQKKPESSDSPYEISSVHRVVAIPDLKLKKPKLV